MTKTSLRGEYSFTFVRDEKFLAKTKEEQIKFIELQIQLRTAKLAVKQRIDDRYSIDDFLSALLSGELIQMFTDIQPSKHFKSRSLPINFSRGHQEYLEKWRYLFFYETFNILINSRRSSEKEDDFAAMQNRLNSRGGAPRRGAKVT